MCLECHYLLVTTAMRLIAKQPLRSFREVREAEYVMQDSIATYAHPSQLRFLFANLLPDLTTIPNRRKYPFPVCLDLPIKGRQSPMRKYKHLSISIFPPYFLSYPGSSNTYIAIKLCNANRS